MSTCSICLNEVRQTRNNPPIRCGHVFHSSCLDEWKSKGHNTCPLYRKIFDASNFNIIVTIQNNYEATSNTLSMTNEDDIFNIIDMFDINFNVNDTEDLNSILSDLRMSLSDFDPSILNTE